MKRINSKKSLILLSLFLSVQALGSSGFAIMQKNSDQQKSDDETCTIRMEMIDKRGKIRTRELSQVERTSTNDLRQNLIRFLNPMDVKGTGFLSIEKEQGEDDQWLYLPALKRSRRISASDESDSFMGSEFSYEDINDEDLTEFSYTLLESQTVNDHECFVIEAKPTSAEKITNSGYSKRILYIDKSNYIALRIEYFDQNGEHLKIYQAENIRYYETAKKYRTHKMVMKNLKNGRTTILYIDNVQINQGVDNSTFTLRNLEDAS